MKNFPYGVIIRPHITEKSVALSYGDEVAASRRLRNEAKKAGEKVPTQIGEEHLVRKYTFIVARGANKLEIKAAVEAIYNEGKKREQAISVTSVRTIKVLGKKRRRGFRTSGYEPDLKKAIVTLGPGQMLEDYGV